MADRDVDVNIAQSLNYSDTLKKKMWIVQQQLYIIMMDLVQDAYSWLLAVQWHSVRRLETLWEYSNRI